MNDDGPPGDPDLYLTAVPGYDDPDPAAASAVWQQAMDRAATSRRTLVVPPHPAGGSWRFDRSFVPPPGQLAMRGAVPAGREGTSCAMTVSGAPFWAGAGPVQGFSFTDLAFCSAPSDDGSRPFQTGVSVWQDCRFERCHFLWFASCDFTTTRCRFVHCYFNLLTGTGLSPTAGLIRWAGSDSFVQHVYADSRSETGLNTRPLVHFDNLSMSSVDFLYLTPSATRPFRISGYTGGTRFAHLVVNGLTVKRPQTGTLADRPAAGQVPGRSYTLTDSPDAGRTHRSDGDSWLLFHDGTVLAVDGGPDALPPAADHPTAFATCTAGGQGNGIRTWWSDGTRWRGPLMDAPIPQLLGADLGALVDSTRGTVNIESLWLRQTAQFDAAQPGALRVVDAADPVHVGLLAQEQTYGTLVAACGSGTAVHVQRFTPGSPVIACDPGSSVTTAAAAAVR